MPACFRKGGTQFSITECAAEGEDPSDQPAEEQDHGIFDFLHNKAGGREDTRPDHVGNDENGGSEETDLPFKLMILRMIFHREPCWRLFRAWVRVLTAALIKDYRGE